MHLITLLLTWKSCVLLFFFHYIFSSYYFKIRDQLVHIAVWPISFLAFHHINQIENFRILVFPSFLPPLLSSNKKKNFFLNLSGTTIGFALHASWIYPSCLNIFCLIILRICALRYPLLLNFQTWLEFQW